MEIKELIKELKKLPQDKNIVFGNDEELNVLFSGVEVARLEDCKEGEFVIYGLNSNIVEDDFDCGDMTLEELEEEIKKVEEVKN
jgi:hypothetical protein